MTKKKILNIVLKILLPIILILLTVAAYMIPKMSFYDKKIADLYSSEIFPIVSIPGTAISNMFFFSLTEMLVVVGSVFLVVLFICFIVYLIKSIIRRNVLSYLYRVLVFLLTVTFVMFTGFQLMHGYNYRRTPASKKLEIKTRKRDVEDIAEVQQWAYMNMIEARQELGEDYNGVAHMMTSLPESVYHANDLVDSASRYYDLDLSTNFIRTKPVMLSHYWYYTGIIGVYDAFIGESNVNVDIMMPKEFPLTLCHEIIHAKGYAAEGDANLISTIACIRSDRADFRYAGYYEIFNSVTSILDNYEDFAYNAEYQMVMRDDEADYYHWLSFHEDELANKVNDISEAANDTFLKANDQEEGTDSYIVDSNLYVEFYYEYVFGVDD